MKRNLLIITLSLGLLCTLSTQAMEMEKEQAENQIVDPNEPINIPITVTIDSPGSPSNLPKIIHAQAERHVTLQDPANNELEALERSVRNLDEQPKEIKDEIEIMLENHQASLKKLTQKYNQLMEHTEKLHTALVHLKEPKHYSLHLPSASGTSIITLFAADYILRATYHLIKHDDEVKNKVGKVILASGVLAWAGAQTYHHWKAFFTPTLSEKEEKKISETENKILNDETKGQ